MTVAELIAALQKLNPDLPVWTAGEWDYCPMNRVRVKTVVNGPCDSVFGELVVLDYMDSRYTEDGVLEMTEIDLLLIRQREHEICCAELVLQRRKLMGAIPSSINYAENDIYSLLDARESHLKYLEQQGHDYLTITAEMARIRAEVRGEE